MFYRLTFTFLSMIRLWFWSLGQSSFLFLWDTAQTGEVGELSSQHVFQKAICRHKHTLREFKKKKKELEGGIWEGESKNKNNKKKAESLSPCFPPLFPIFSEAPQGSDGWWAPNGVWNLLSYALELWQDPPAVSQWTLPGHRSQWPVDGQCHHSR